MNFRNKFQIFQKIQKIQKSNSFRSTFFWKHVNEIIKHSKKNQQTSKRQIDDVNVFRKLFASTNWKFKNRRFDVDQKHYDVKQKKRSIFKFVVYFESLKFELNCIDDTKRDKFFAISTITLKKSSWRTRFCRRFVMKCW